MMLLSLLQILEKKYKIITDDNLDSYLSVDEGLDKRLKKVINKSNSLDELIKNTKTRRYTYNRLMRMMIHVLVGVKKTDKEIIDHNDYMRVRGGSADGQ